MSIDITTLAIAKEYTKRMIGSGISSGPAYVASEEPPEDTRALWVDTAEPEEAVALGATAVETAEGVDLYCTDELGTTKVTVLNGRDGAQGPRGEAGPAGPAGPQGAPGDDYVLTDEDRQEIAGIAAGMVEVPEGGGGFSLPLLYELTTTEEVRWIDTGDSAFQAKNILIISLLSKATETNEADYAMSGSFHTKDVRANCPWSNLAVAREVASGLSKQYNMLFSAIGFRGDGGVWMFVHNIRNEVNSYAVQSFAQTGSYGYPALRVPITGMILGDAKAATDTTRVFGVGTTLQIWGC